MNYKVLATATRYFKEDKNGMRAMSRVIEEMITEVVTADEKKFSAVRMLERGKYTNEEIAEDFGAAIRCYQKAGRGITTSIANKVKENYEYQEREILYEISCFLQMIINIPR